MRRSFKRFCYLYQNELGIMWTRRDEAEKALRFLETAEFIYQRYMKEVILFFYVIKAAALLME